MGCWQLSTIAYPSMVDIIYNIYFSVRPITKGMNNDAFVSNPKKAKSNSNHCNKSM